MTAAVSDVTGLSRDCRLTRPKKEHPQDVFQAREDMRAKEARRREKVTGEIEILFVLENFLLKAEGLDPDGVDLMFTMGKVKVDPSKDKMIEKMMKKVDNVEATPGPGCYNSMQRPLQQIFDDYFKQWTVLDTEKNKITIIVLTDGLWKLDKHLGQPPTERPVSVEFVQFGKDPEATFRLKRLDNELENEGIIVLLGSFVEAYDEMEGDDEVFDPTSPSHRNSYMSGHYSNADQSSFPSPGQLPRSQMLQAHTGPSNNSDMWDYGERPNAVMHGQFNSQ
ncbi:hypothetical protein DL98DRAFT_528241 [Cadophora sp. DSE1049]|nr:hypothetical protein DL98DRAFT_528241 [Cadophora sp. DSE1049]